MKALFVIVVSVLLMSCATVEVTERQDNCKKVTDPGNYKQYHGDKCSLVVGNEYRKHDVIQCPYCLKEGGSSNMKRYHFDKCKHKK